jgi:hypothetical protein
MVVVLRLLLRGLVVSADFFSVPTKSTLYTRTHTQPVILL